MTLELLVSNNETLQLAALYGKLEGCNQANFVAVLFAPIVLLLLIGAAVVLPICIGAGVARKVG